MVNKLELDGRTLYELHEVRGRKRNKFLFQVDGDWSAGVTDDQATEVAIEVQKRYNLHIGLVESLKELLECDYTSGTHLYAAQMRAAGILNELGIEPDFLQQKRHGV